jgi:hypothetical protein
MAKERRVWSRLLWMGVALTVPAVLIAMVIPMLSESAMHALEKEVVPGLTIQVLILFILVTPVQFGLGSRFYIGAYKALKYVVSPFCARVSSGDVCHLEMCVIWRSVQDAHAPHCGPTVCAHHRPHCPPPSHSSTPEATPTEPNRTQAFPPCLASFLSLSHFFFSRFFVSS